MFWWGYLLYPLILLTRMASFSFLWFRRLVFYFTFGIPLNILDWLLWNLFIGVYFWLLWILGTLFQLLAIFLSPASRPLYHMLWFLVFLFGGVVDLSIPSSFRPATCWRPCWSIQKLPRSVGVSTDVYSLSGWMTPFLWRLDHGVGTFNFDSSQTSVRLSSILLGYYGILFRSCGQIPSGWITELLFIILYLVSGTYFFSQSLFRIFASRFGWWHTPSFCQVSSAFHTNYSSVSVLTADQLSLHALCTDFSPGQQTAIVDNCANMHVWSIHSHFVKYCSFSPGERAVSTIGSRSHYPHGIGDVSVSWRDDNDVVFQHVLKDVLHFPDSPVNIISAHKLACEWGPTIDQEGTSIKTKYAYSVFKWKNKQFRKTILHPVHGLPEMVINNSVSGIFSTFCHYISHGASLARVHFCTFATASSPHNIFIPHLVWQYSWDGFTSSCQILHTVDAPGFSPQIVIKLLCGRILHTSPEYLQHMEDPDVASNFWKEVNLLSDDDLSFLANPRALDPLEEDWLRWHHRLNHLS